MKQYDFVNRSYHMKDMVMIAMTKHRSIIAAYAAMGYEFITMIPAEVSATGCIRKIDLAISKETDA